MAVAIKEKRIEFRVSQECKNMLETAARLAKISLSSYIVSTVLKQAKMDIEQNEVISLTNSERNMFLKALLNPPKPNTALKKLFK